MFVPLILTCMSYLYNLNSNHLSYISFANSLAHSVGWLFYFFFFFDSSIYCGKRFYIITFDLFIFAFVYFAWVDKLKKNVSKPSVKGCIDYAAIFSRSFMISSHIQDFHPFWIYFCVWCEKMFWFYMGLWRFHQTTHWIKYIFSFLFFAIN